jgi:hypothetical protein
MLYSSLRRPQTIHFGRLLSKLCRRLRKVANRVFPTAVFLKTAFDALIDSFLAIRTLASTSLFEIKAFESDNAQLIERALIYNSDTGGRPIVDVQISSPSSGIVVNDHGAVYKCNFGSGWKSL